MKMDTKLLTYPPNPKYFLIYEKKNFLTGNPTQKMCLLLDGAKDTFNR